MQTAWGCLQHPLLASPTLPQPWMTAYGLSGPTYLLHLLLLAIGTDALEGLLGVVCVPTLLLICLLGLGVWKGVIWGPRVRLPEPSLPSPCWGCGWRRHLFTRDRDLEVGNGEGEGSPVPSPLPPGDV